jgi:hypothetical protein
MKSDPFVTYMHRKQKRLQNVFNAYLKYGGLRSPNFESVVYEMSIATKTLRLMTNVFVISIGKKCFDFRVPCYKRMAGTSR